MDAQNHRLQHFGRIAVLGQGHLLGRILVAEVATLIQVAPDLSQAVQQAFEIQLLKASQGE